MHLEETSLQIVATDFTDRSDLLRFFSKAGITPVTDPIAWLEAKLKRGDKGERDVQTTAQ